MRASRSFVSDENKVWTVKHGLHCQPIPGVTAGDTHVIEVLAVSGNKTFLPDLHPSLITGKDEEMNDQEWKARLVGGRVAARVMTYHARDAESQAR